jgi:hypothetical protein
MWQTYLFKHAVWWRGPQPSSQAPRDHLCESPHAWIGVEALRRMEDACREVQIRQPRSAARRLVALTET